jgi:hypothetical protein
VHCSTPLGTVTFDANRINSYGRTIFIQTQTASNSVNSDTNNEIVGPSILLTAGFIYPMPSWSERIYKWSLTNTVDKKRCIFTAGIMSIILIGIIVTVVIHRNEVDIRMLHYLHIVMFCVAAIVFNWANALLYQVCLYTYIFIYIYTYIHTYIHMYIHINMNIYTCIHILFCVSAIVFNWANALLHQVRLYTYIFIYLYMYVYLCIHIYIPIYIYMNIYTCIHIFLCLGCSLQLGKCFVVSGISLYIYIYIFVYIYLCIHIYIPIYI